MIFKMLDLIVGHANYDEMLLTFTNGDPVDRVKAFYDIDDIEAGFTPESWGQAFIA